MPSGRASRLDHHDDDGCSVTAPSGAPPVSISRGCGPSGVGRSASEGIGGGAVVGGSVTEVWSCAEAWAGATPVWLSLNGWPRPGVGSKLTHPTPAKYTSGQAWACTPRTT